MDDKEPFLSRWSRRKLAAKEDAPDGAPQAGALPAAAPAAPLASATGLPVPGSANGNTPEYREFFDPQVDEELRRTALRKLFSEPQFNVMDGLDTYIDDYSKPDPIPEAMLRQLNQAKDLFLFEEEKKADVSAGDEALFTAGVLAPAAPEAAADTSTLPQTPPASAPDKEAGAATSAAAAPPGEGKRNGERND